MVVKHKVDCLEVAAQAVGQEYYIHQIWDLSPQVVAMLVAVSQAQVAVQAVHSCHSLAAANNPWVLKCFVVAIN